MDYNTFANTIKQKYPEYKDMDNLELSQKIVTKYPVYKEKVTLPKEKGVFAKVKSTVEKSGEEYGDIINSNQGNAIQRGIQAFGTAARGVGQVGMDVLGTIPGFTKGAKAVSDIAGKGIEKTVGAISDIPAVQRAAQGLTPELEQNLKTVSSLGEIAALPLAGAGAAKTGTVVAKGLAATPKALATVAEATGKGIKQIPQAISKTGNYVVDTLATENPAKLAKIKTTVGNNLNEYAQEFSKSRNAVAGATNKIDGFDYGKHVSERGLLPNVTDSGRFDGSEIIKGLETENSGFRNVVNTKLEASTRTTPVESLRQALLEDVTSKSNIGDADSIRTYVDKYINEVKNRYGDNLTDKQIYDIKTDADSGYNYASPNADINASKIIADRARQFIKGDKEIADALDAQSKNYEAIRITKALEPQKVKAGTLSTRLAQLGGSLLGAGAVEGGVLQKTLAATLGGLAGGKLVKAIQQAAFISPSARAALKKELLKLANPQEVKVILKNIDNGIVDLPVKQKSLLQRAGEIIKNTPNKQGGFAKNPFAKGFKDTDELTQSVAKAIDEIDLDPVKVDGQLNFGNVDDIMLLDKAKARVRTGKPLTVSEAEYYAPILKRNGIDVYAELDNANLIDKDFTFKDSFGGSANGTVKGDTLNLYDVFAKEKGNGLYENAIKEAQKQGIKKLEVTLQSLDSTKALNKLVEKGILKNPRNLYNEVGYPRTFDIAQLEEIYKKVKKK